MKEADWSQFFAGGWEADGKPLYVCRANLSKTGEATDELSRNEDENHGDMERTHPGKTGPHLHGACVPFGEREVVSHTGFEILLRRDNAATSSTSAQSSHIRAVPQRIQPHPHKIAVHFKKELDVESIKNKLQGEYTWLEGCNGSVPPGALRIGTDSDGNRLFVARFMMENGSMQIGKVGSHLGCAHVSFGGGVKTSKQYEVLCWTHMQ